VRSYLVDRVSTTDEMFRQVDELLLGDGTAQVGDKVLVIAGSPPGVVGSTNDMRVHRIGEAINELPPPHHID